MFMLPDSAQLFSSHSLAKREGFVLWRSMQDMDRQSKAITYLHASGVRGWA